LSVSAGGILQGFVAAAVALELEPAECRVAAVDKRPKNPVMLPRHRMRRAVGLSASGDDIRHFERRTRARYTITALSLAFAEISPIVSD